MRVLSFFLFLLLLSQSAWAQLEPVQWSFEVEKVNDLEYDVIFTARMDKGWSVYSQYLESDQGPVATSFAFDPNNAVELVGQTQEFGHRKEAFDALFNMTLIKFSGRAKFTQRVKVDYPGQSIKGHLTYMTCDDNSCLPPTDVRFDIALKD
ncbi:MAG: protein-disulfide reductase DsbD domain-containing protein [Bacteroidota bacterium]